MQMQFMKEIPFTFPSFSAHRPPYILGLDIYWILDKTIRICL